MKHHKTTEQDSLYTNLEKMSTSELVQYINEEDQKVALAIKKSLPSIEKLIDVVAEKLKNGGRLFYIGAGTSGRLGILDASECPPTFGVPHELVVGIIAGGDTAIRKAVENAEDDDMQGWIDLLNHHINEKDVVIGIAASGTTPYVVSALETCQKNNIVTGCITMNTDTPLERVANHPIVVHVGPEFVTGSSRMKAGSAQKMVLNMISTATMILLGKVKGNKMVDMQLSNDKLVDRGTQMLVNELQISYAKAKELLLTHGSVRNVINYVNNEQ